MSYYVKLHTQSIIKVSADTAAEILRTPGNVKNPAPTYLALYEVSEAWEHAREGKWRVKTGWAPCVWDWCRGVLPKVQS